MTMSMGAAWVWLVSAIVFEVCGTVSMKLSEGFTHWRPSAAMAVFYGLSLCAMTLAFRRIDVSVAYTVWSGLGTALIALIGVLWFKEPTTAVKVVSLLLIIGGIVGLNLSGGAH